MAMRFMAGKRMNKRTRALGLLILGMGILCFGRYARLRFGFDGPVSITDRKAESRRANVLDDRRASRSPRPPEANRMSSDEAKAFLRETKIRELDLEDASMPDAVIHLNQILREQLPDAKPLKIIWMPGEPDHTVSIAKIKRLHLRDVPVATALKYMGDATRCTFRVYDGAVIVEPFRFLEPEDYEKFLTEVRIDLEIRDANALEAMEALNVAAAKPDFRTEKPHLGVVANDELRAAIVGDEDSNRIRGVSLRNVTIEEALREICRQSATYYEIFESEIQLVPMWFPENPKE